MKKTINKETRLKVYNKYDGHCAYCGKEITYKQLQVDHIHPQARAHWYKHERMSKGLPGDNINHIDNLNPACARCNRWKCTYTLETFRKEIQRMNKKLNRDSPQYRMAVDYGLIIPTDIKVKFYFEKYLETLQENHND